MQTRIHHYIDLAAQNAADDGLPELVANVAHMRPTLAEVTSIINARKDAFAGLFRHQAGLQPNGKDIYVLDQVLFDQPAAVLQFLRTMEEQ